MIFNIKFASCGEELLLCLASGTVASAERGEEGAGVKMMSVSGPSWLLSGLFHNKEVSHLSSK